MRKGGWTSRLLAVVALASMCAVVDAAEPREFNIPGGELKAALDAYMQQSGAQLIYWTEDVRGIRTQPVVGTMTPEDALQQLLQNTPFVIKRNASGAMALVARNMAHGSGAAEASDTPTAATGRAGEHGLEEVTVTGFRASLQSAQDKKRYAPSNVEAITLEDLGKFTDSSISDALQRVPGVNLQRNVRGYDGGDGASIRGLGPAYVQSTVNGRVISGIPTFFGGGTGRDLDFGSIPPEILVGVTVYKSPTSSQMESGLAGEIDLQTLRPLDYKQHGMQAYYGNLTAAANRQTDLHQTGPRIGGVFGAKLLDNTLGVYVSGLYSKEHTQQQELYMYNGRHNITVSDKPVTSANYTNGVYDPTIDPTVTLTTIKGVGINDGYAPNVSYRQYTKKSVSTGLQWKPNSNFELNVDALYNKFTTDKFNQGADFYSGFNYETGHEIYNPGSYIIRGNQMVYYDTSKIANPAGTTPTFTLGGFTHVINENEFYMMGLNAAWTSDQGYRMAVDYSHGRGRYSQDWRGPYADNGLFGGTQTTFDGRGKEPIFTFTTANPLANPADPAAYENYYNFVFDSLNRDTRDSFMLDFEVPFAEHTKLKVGSRYDETTVNFILGYGPQGPIANPAGYFSGTVNLPFYPIPFAAGNEAGLCANNPDSCNTFGFGHGSFVGDFPRDQAGKPGDVFSFQQSESYYVKETNTAFYAQVDNSGTLFGTRYSGNAGVRAVHMTEDALGFRGITYLLAFGAGHDPNNTDQTVLAEDNNAYWTVLPSFNLTLKPEDNINVRLGVAKSMSLAGYKSLSPRGGAKIYAPVRGADETATFSGGNTRLNPTVAWNYDLTGEYYTKSGAAYIVSLFYKDVKDLFTGTTSLGVKVPGFGDRLFNVTTTVNGNYGNTYGLEVGANQPLTFLASPWDGFGVQANYTDIESSLHILNDSGTYQFPGASRHNLNATGYYEKHGWAARAAYTYHTAYTDTVGTNDQTNYVRPFYSVDASLSKMIGTHLQLVLTGTNLNGSNQIHYVGSGKMFQSYFERPTTYTLGVRASL